MKHFSLLFASLSILAGGLLLSSSPAQAQARGWDDVPHELRDIQRQGFHDGIEGARRDFESGRRADVNAHEEYRHPHVPPPAVEDYRDGFRRGYDAGVRHFFASAPQAPPPPPIAVQDPEVYRHNGFEDGQAGAQKDYGNQRMPDVNNRDEYRHPNVPAPFVEIYRDGFRHGYERMAHQLYPAGGPVAPPVVQVAPPPPPPTSPWQTMPYETVAPQRQGFIDGILAASFDYEQQMPPDPNRHPEYAHPQMNFLQRVVYKTGYKQGYDTAMQNFASGLPGVSNQLERHAFIDGLGAAHRDFDARQRLDIRAHPEFDGPRVPPQFVEEYRHSFRQGFDLANSYLF